MRSSHVTVLFLSNLNQSTELQMEDGIFSEADVVGGSDIAHLQQKERSMTLQGHKKRKKSIQYRLPS